MSSEFDVTKLSPSAFVSLRGNVDFTIAMFDCVKTLAEIVRDDGDIQGFIEHLGELLEQWADFDIELEKIAQVHRS